MIVCERYQLTRFNGFRSSPKEDKRSSDESEKCTLSALCALFDNRSAASTPSLAALHLYLSRLHFFVPGICSLVIARV